MSKETIFSFTIPMSTNPQIKQSKENLEEEVKDLKNILKMEYLEKLMFQKHIEDLENKEVYELPDIQKILPQINFTKSKNLKLWYKNMENSLYTCNEKIYSQLINTVKT